MRRVAADNSPFCRFELCFTSVTGGRLCAASNSPFCRFELCFTSVTGGRLCAASNSPFCRFELCFTSVTGGRLCAASNSLCGGSPLTIRRFVSSSFALPPLPADINVINIRLRTILHNLSSTPILLKKPINYRTAFSTKQNPREPQLSGILLYYINFRIAVR